MFSNDVKEVGCPLKDTTHLGNNEGMKLMIYKEEGTLLPIMVQVFFNKQGLLFINT